MSKNSIYDKFGSFNDYDSIRDELLSGRVTTQADLLDSEKNERTFSFSNYQDDLLTVSGAETVALLILNLLFTRPGNYPNSPDMGINIQKYKFEFIDNQTLSEIEHEINSQIDTYLSNTVIAQVSLSRSEDEEEKRNTIIVSITVTTSSGSQVFKYPITN